MQFQGKLMIQTEENDENLIFGLDLGLLGLNLGHIFFFFFFSKNWLRQSLDVMVSYHHVQYQEHMIIQS